MILSLPFYRDEVFENLHFSENELTKTDFDNCRFLNCNFSNQHLTRTNFTECQFENCDLSNTFLTGTTIQECDFEKCKMLGLKFEACNPILLSFTFRDCQLNFSSFYSLSLKNTAFINCNLEQVDFTETDLSNSVFKNCDLMDAVFDQTNLEGADLTTAVNLLMDPEKNHIRKAIFSTANVSGLLDKYKVIIK